MTGLKVLAARGLTFDHVGILPRHLEHVPVFAQGIPDLRIVIDHLGKPPIVRSGFEPWGSLLALAAQMPSVFAKVSGLDAGQSDRWTAADIAPYLDHPLELFGPDRLMFGSDWPVAILRGGYAKVWHETNVGLGSLSRDERKRNLGRNRRRCLSPPYHRNALRGIWKGDLLIDSFLGVRAGVGCA